VSYDPLLGVRRSQLYAARLDVRVFRTASECIAAAKAAYAPLLTGGRH